MLLTIEANFWFNIYSQPQLVVMSQTQISQFALVDKNI